MKSVPTKDRPSPATDAIQCDDHLGGGFGSVDTGVAVGAAGAVERLLLRVGGEHAEDDREVLTERDLLDAAGCFARDIIKVRRVAADDAAEADDGFETLRLRQRLGGD